MKTGAVGKGGYVKVNLAMDSLVSLSVDVNFSREDRNTFLNVKSNPIKSLKQQHSMLQISIAIESADTKVSIFSE